MNNPARTTFLAVLIVLCLSLPQAMQGQDIDQDEVLSLRRQGKLLPLDTLLQTVQQRYPNSRLLETELERDDDQYVYELEILTGRGTVREIEIDAATGTILEDEEED